MLLLLLIGMEDGGWDCVGERVLKSVASLIFYIYLTYLTYFTYFTIFAHYYYLQSLRTHSSTPKYLNPFVAFPEAKRTGVAWHVGDSASLSGGVAASETRVARSIAVAVPVSLLVVGTRKRASDHGETCQSVGRRACVDPRPSELRNSIAYLKAKDCD